MRRRRDRRATDGLGADPDDRDTGNLGVVTTLTAAEIPGHLAASAHDPRTTRARLVVLHGVQPGRRYPLDERSVLGRGSQCAVQIDDAMCSRRHAVIERRDTGWVVSDLGSRNGIRLNGATVSQGSLTYGDRLQIGETVFLFSHIDPLEERVLHRQKLEAIGRLGAGIAHDINNVLGGILMNVDYVLGLGDRGLEDPEVRECLSDLRAATILGADLTRRILAVARRTAAEHVQVDLSALVLDTIEIARRTFDRSIRVERSVAPEIHVRGDRCQIQQMMMNLLLNARDAMPAGGVIRVTLSHARTSEVEAEMVAVAGVHAKLVVTDTGDGMDGATRARIFEPFFTTKSDEHGSGLGLATVMDVVTGHGGTIECDSTPGRGSEFRIVLPALAAAARGESRTPGFILRPSVPPRAARILIVDDEPLSRRSLGRLLVLDGNSVLEAADGVAAVEVFAKDAAGIDAIIMDLDMPELDGLGAMERMQALDPGVRVVFLTGFVTDGRRRELYDRGARAVLDKPCGAATLRKAIATVLATRGQIETAPPLIKL